MSGQTTPGPWAIAPETNGTELVAYTPAPWRVRAVICRGNFAVNPNWRNDTRLIAAAPELLEALEELHLKAVVGTNDERHAALNKAWAAISKARGEQS
jgi:hypothetical protein